MCMYICINCNDVYISKHHIEGIISRVSNIPENYQWIHHVNLQITVNSLRPSEAIGLDQNWLE